MKTFCLPDLGEGLQEAEVVSWHVNVGDRVVEDQPLVSVETDKAVVDIPSPWSGRVAELFVAPGDILAIGAPLAKFDIDGGHADAGAIVALLRYSTRPGRAFSRIERASSGRLTTRFGAFTFD